MTAPLTIADLKPWPKNPREIRDDEAARLRRGIERFGDISGITFNSALGWLVTGHQRVDALKAQYGAENLRIEDSAIHCPDGKRFAIRLVDWDYETSVEANIAANSPDNQGRFKWDEVGPLLQELQDAGRDIADTCLADFTYEPLMCDQWHPPPREGLDTENPDKHHRSITFTADQWEVIERGIAKIKAAEEDDSITPSRALELIVADYLAG